MIDLLILNSNGLPVFSDGIRISKSTTIDVLLRHGFKLVVNSTEYDVKAPQGFRMLSNNLYQLQVTVASSMFVVLWKHQCSRISWVTLSHKFTGPCTFNKENVMHSTSCRQNYIFPNQQNVDKQQTLAPTNKVCHLTIIVIMQG